MQRLAACLFCLAFASPVAAQPKEPIAPFVVDLRGAYGRHKAEPSVATDLGVTATNLPTRTFGLSGGAHFYPLRRKVSLGVGGNVVFVRGSRAIDITVARRGNAGARTDGAPELHHVLSGSVAQLRTSQRLELHQRRGVRPIEAVCRPCGRAGDRPRRIDRRSTTAEARAGSPPTTSPSRSISAGIRWTNRRPRPASSRSRGRRCWSSAAGFPSDKAHGSGLRAFTSWLKP